MAADSKVGRIGIWGKSGSGKSHYTKNRLKGKKRVIVFDPMREYAAVGFEAVGPTLDDVRRGIIANPRGFRLAYQPPASAPLFKSLNALSSAIVSMQEKFAAGKGGATMTLVVDEMRLSFPVHGGAEKCPHFSRLCSTGRHYGVELIGTSQRIAEVSTNFRGNCSETVVFALKGARDIPAAANELGMPKGGDQQIVKLAKMKYHHLHEKDGEINLINATGRKIRNVA